MWCELHDCHFYGVSAHCHECVEMYKPKPSQALAMLKLFFMFFFLQAMSYGLICWNYRAVAKGWVGHVVVSDLMFAALNFTLIKKVAEAKGWVAMAGYIAGGAVGSAVSVLFTKALWGS